jgi:hemolysin activation/secretion protein
VQGSKKTQARQRATNGSGTAAGDAPAANAAGGNAPAAGAVAAQPKGPPPHFDIDDFAVQGVNTLPQLELEQAIYPFLGPNKTADDVEKARAALEKAYLIRPSAFPCPHRTSRTRWSCSKSPSSRSAGCG